MSHYKKLFPERERRSRQGLNSSGFDNVKPEKPDGAKVGWSTDYGVEKTLVGRHATVQMTAVVEVMEAGVPMTFREIWEKAQAIHRVGDRTVRQHLQRMIEAGRVVRLEAPSFSPLYVISGGTPRQWYRCRDCAKVTASDMELPDEIDRGQVDGAYAWGTCRECMDSGVEVTRSKLGGRWPLKKSGGFRTPGQLKAGTYPTSTSIDHLRPEDDPGSDSYAAGLNTPDRLKDKD